MRVLIVVSNKDLGILWQRYLERGGKHVTLVTTQDDAVAELASRRYAVVVLDLHLEEGSALAVSDYASYRHPNLRVLVVTRDRFFSDGSIFMHSANACALVKEDMRLDDLDAMVEHFAMEKPRLSASGGTPKVFN
ncbi:MAG: hypothetical protein ACPGNV_05050 [Mangrovicoccus sp.]